jgi:hypothetical protein
LVILLGYYCVVETNSKRLQANTASALSAIARGSHVNQNLIASIPGAVKGLVELAASKNSVCQVKAASAIESLAQRNVNVQRLVEDAGAVRPLIRLLKIWSIEVKEQGNTILITTCDSQPTILDTTCDSLVFTRAEFFVEIYLNVLHRSDSKI